MAEIENRHLAKPTVWRLMQTGAISGSSGWWVEVGEPQDIGVLGDTAKFLRGKW